VIASLSNLKHCEAPRKTISASMRRLRLSSNNERFHDTMLSFCSDVFILTLDIDNDLTTGIVNIRSEYQ
jgi:hypothetical protein